MRGLDTDRDRKLSRDEFVEGFARWFVRWDSRNQGVLAADQIRDGLNKDLSYLTK
jgi:hypothetical protein